MNPSRTFSSKRQWWEKWAERVYDFGTLVEIELQSFLLGNHSLLSHERTRPSDIYGDELSFTAYLSQSGSGWANISN